MGCAEGQSHFAGSLKVFLRCNIFPLPGQGGGRGMVEWVFSTLLAATCYDRRRWSIQGVYNE